MFGFETIRVMRNEGSAKGKTLVVVLSGDAPRLSGVPVAVAETMHAEGYSVLLFNSFLRWWRAGWLGQTGKVRPYQMFNDIFRQMVKVMNLTHLSRIEGIILVGYSFGADVMPFLATHFRELRYEGYVKAVVLLEPGEKAAFQPSILGWRNIEYGTQPVLPELLKAQEPTMVFYADDTVPGYMGGRKNSPARGQQIMLFNHLLVRSVDEAGHRRVAQVETEYLGGDHTFDGRFTEVATKVRDWVSRVRETEAA